MAVEQTILNEDMEVDQRIVNEERYENENGEHMESNVFVTYSDHNLAEIYASLIDKNDNDLKKLLPSLICDTETYVHDLEKEGKGFAFKIKGHYLDFHKHAVCNFKSDKVIMKGIKRLEKLWKMLDIFYDFDQMEDKQAEVCKCYSN
uniref:Uncharacterized protein n=1 Tax=Panagrolaimus davidi TaxID=227884 RepID=A0A914QNH1_9BILA